MHVHLCFMVWSFFLTYISVMVHWIVPVETHSSVHTCSWVPVNCETKRETKYTETKRNSTKRNEIYRNETKSMRSEINRNEIDRNEKKRYNTKWNKTYFNETIGILFLILCLAWGIRLVTTVWKGVYVFAWSHNM